LTRRHPAGVCGVADLQWGVCAYVGDVRVRYKPRIPSKKGTNPGRRTASLLASLLPAIEMPCPSPS
jgi:hypothetical protein